jgi:LPXTG-motif cell wall-anchored protein
MQNPIVRRWLAGLGVAGALVAAAGPAHAVAPGAKLAVYLSDTTIAVGSNGKVGAPVLYSTAGTLTLRDLKVRYDFSDLAGVVTVTEAASIGDCSAPNDHQLVCTVPYEFDVDEWGTTGAVDIVIAPTEKAKDGDEGDLKVSFAAPGHETVTHTAKVRIGEGVDIAAGEDLTRSGAPGSAFSTPLTVSNAGETAIQGTVAIFYNDYGYRATTKFSNCTYADDDLLTCRFDETLQPDTSYTAELPYTIGADAEAPGKEFAEIAWMTTAEFEDYTAYLNRLGVDLGKKGDGDELALTKVAGVKAQGRQADTAPENNWSSVTVTVTGKQDADLSALGATLTGEAGDVVTANVGLRNDGPATIDVRRGGGPFTNAYLTVPPGTTVVGVPENCAPRDADGTNWSEAGNAGAKAYHCWSSSFIKVGDRETYPFKLRIDEVVANATGSIAINFDCQCDGRTSDLDGSNDEAEILVNPTDGGGAGGGGLPVTGASTGIVAGAGAVLLAAGAFGFVLARRRRTRFVA